MADPFPIRPISADEYAGFRRVHDHAFNSGPLSGARAERAVRQFEPERSLAAMDAALPAGGLRVAISLPATATQAASLIS